MPLIDVTLLGTAALMPIPERALTAATLACAGRSVLLDCGEGTQTAARRARVSLMKADVVALTHYHGDHIFGLPGLLQTLNVAGRTEPLYIIGPGDPAIELSPILRLAGATNYDIIPMTLPPGGLGLRALTPGWPEGARLSAFATEHRTVSQGYCFTLSRPGAFMPERARALGVPTPLWGLLQKGQTVEIEGARVAPEQVLGAPRRGLKVVFSGDTAACDSLLKAAEEADLLICDATYGLREQAALAAKHGHMSFDQAARVAARSSARRLWLAHYSQMIADPNEYLPIAREAFPDAVCGEDGLQITLRFTE